MPVALFDGCKNGGWHGIPALRELTLLNVSLIRDDFYGACEVFGPQLRSFAASHLLVTDCEVWSTDQYADSILRPYDYPFDNGIFEGDNAIYAGLRFFTNLERLRLEMSDKCVAIWDRVGAVLDDCTKSVHSRRCKCSVPQCGVEDCWDLGGHYFNVVKEQSANRAKV